MDQNTRLKNDYPWIQTPLIVGAPMRLIALAEMAVEISKAGTTHFPTFLLSPFLLTTPRPAPNHRHHPINLTPQTHRRHRLHRRRHRRLRAIHAPPTSPDAPPRDPAPHLAHASHRHRLHKLGCQPLPLHPANRPIPPQRSMVLRAVYAVLARGMDDADTECKPRH